MSKWPSSKANRVYRALLSIGWELKTETAGSHKKLQRAGFPTFTWAWHDSAELGPRILQKIAKKTGLKPENL